MPIAIAELPVRASGIGPPRKIWTRRECGTMESTGLFDGQKLELVQGELIDKIAKNPLHVAVGILLLKWFTEVFGWRAVRPEAPIDVIPEDNPTNRPEPDLAVLSPDYQGFRTSNPRPSQLLLVIEIADTTPDWDLAVKGPLYARAKIPEYWVLDVKARQLFVHRDPKDGAYKAVVVYSESETVAPLSAPGRMFRLG